MPPPPPGQSRRGKALWGRGKGPHPSACREDQGCWVFSASMNPLSERPSLASLVPSVQWGQLTSLVVWCEGLSGPQTLGEERRLSPGVVGGAACLVLHCASPPTPPPARRPPASLSCFCFSQPQVETSPGLSVLTPRAPKPMEWRPEVWGAPRAYLLSSSPCVGSFPFSGPGGGDKLT